MRIAVVSNSKTFLGRFRGELLVTLQALGHDVVALSPNDSYARLVDSLPVEHIQIPLVQHGLNPLEEAKTVSALWSAFRRLRPELAINFTIKPAIYGSAAATLAGVERCVSVFTGLGYWFTDSNGSGVAGRVIQRALSFALRSNEMVFFQNEDDRRLLIANGLVRPSATRVIDGSGVDTRMFVPQAHAPVPDTFLLVGRLLREKGIREFVAAAREIRRRFGGARFWLLGPIDTSRSAISRAELEQWCAAGDVEYLGEVPDVREIVARAGVVVLPSYREGLPRSILEAMAMGKAIVTTDTPGSRETVRDGVNGFLVPPHEVDPLVEAIQRFIDDPGLAARMGVESRRMALERFDVRKVNAAFLGHLGLITDVHRQASANREVEALLAG